MKNRYIDNQKVLVADEIKRNIWKSLVQSDDSGYNYVYNDFPVQNKYPSTLFGCPHFEKKRYIENKRFKLLTWLSVISANIW